MEAIVLPLTYFGNLSYFKKLYHAEQVWIDDDEVYLKQTFRNRTQILAANGKLDLSVPIVATKGMETPIKDIQISYDDPWQVKHWRTIQSAYKSAPFFEEYEDDIKALIVEKHVYLHDLNKATLTKIIELFGKNVALNYSGDTEIPTKAFSFRGYFKPSKMPDSDFNTYMQVFNYKFGFTPNLSILDLLFNEGPYALEYLLKQNKV